MYCYAYCTARSYFFSELQTALKNYTITHDKEVIHASIDDENVFIFPYGVFILWQEKEKDPSPLFALVKPFEQHPFSPYYSDEFIFSYGKTTHIKHDQFILESKDPAIQLAISHALAQSIKMDSFEQEIDGILKQAEIIPEELAKEGKSSLSKKAISKRMGQLFIVKSAISLHTDVLDTPEFFWDNSEVETIYDLTCKYVDLSARSTVLHRRLEMIKELFQMLRDQLDHRHSMTLEWVIIWLIVIEVIISLSKDVFQLL